MHQFDKAKASLGCRQGCNEKKKIGNNNPTKRNVIFVKSSSFDDIKHYFIFQVSIFVAWPFVLMFKLVLNCVGSSSCY